MTGNHTENFRDIVALFQSHHAVRIVTPAELSLALMQLLADDAGRQALGRRAKEIMRSQTGATARTMAALKVLIVEHQEAQPVSTRAAHTE
jgi:3-deoxy-D-manno-octulosonic-acid transferase